MAEFQRINNKREEIDFLKKIQHLNQKISNIYNNKVARDETFDLSNQKRFKSISEPLKESVKIQKNLAKNLTEQKKITQDKPIGDIKLDDINNLDNEFGIRMTPINRKNDFKITFLGSPVEVFDDHFKVYKNQNEDPIKVYPTKRMYQLITLKNIPFTPTNEELAEYGKILLLCGYKKYLFDMSDNRKKIYIKAAPKKMNYINHAIELYNLIEDEILDVDNAQFGSGIPSIEFLPANKSELLNKLRLLLGEYSSGNTNLYNEIVTIANWLADHKALPKSTINLIQKNLNSVFN